jgi:hypothetical protein
VICITFSALLQSTARTYSLRQLGAVVGVVKAALLLLLLLLLLLFCLVNPTSWIEHTHW